jgi:exodeoxyribonuclease V
MNSEFLDLLYKKFKYGPTESQERLFHALDLYFKEEGEERLIFILKGFAGTGKTSVISALTKTLPQFGWSTVLLAPTGRAAKVISNYSKKSAKTIHRKIYQVSEDSLGNLNFELNKNASEDTVYIVDEASMINDHRDLGSNGLLQDLITFVFNGNRNRLILIGDEAQLPPVGDVYSPALNGEYLSRRYRALVFENSLTDVMRQATSSGILFNATHIRKNLKKESVNSLSLSTSTFKDVFRMSGEKVEDGIRYAYDKYGKENTVLITRSNKASVMYNHLIRSRINYAESELEKGDILMVVKNNYSILEPDSDAGFIANGEFMEVQKLGSEIEMHGFRFQKLTLKLVDYPEEEEFESLVILNVLSSNSPNLSKEENRLLYDSVIKDYYNLTSKKEQKKAIREDKYLNALQIKYAYSLTCHKSQGGQWDAVFIDAPYLPDNKIDTETLRWLYTAITRGSKEVFLINFPNLFFGINANTELE